MRYLMLIQTPISGPIVFRIRRQYLVKGFCHHSIIRYLNFASTHEDSSACTAPYSEFLGVVWVKAGITYCTEETSSHFTARDFDLMEY